MIVLDASLLVDLLLPDMRRRGPAVRERISDEALAVPHLAIVEVMAALRSLSLRGELAETRAQAAIQMLLTLGLERFPHDPLLPRVWELRHHATAYDALYLALAERLGLPLLTGDRPLSKVPGARTPIEWFAP